MSKANEELKLDIFERFRLFPRELLDQKKCNEFVMAEPSLISAIPKKFMTKELGLYVVNKNPWLIKDIPDEIVTQDMYDIVFSNNYRKIVSIPMKFQTKEM